MPTGHVAAVKHPAFLRVQVYLQSSILLHNFINLNKFKYCHCEELQLLTEGETATVKNWSSDIHVGDQSTIFHI